MDRGAWQVVVHGVAKDLNNSLATRTVTTNTVFKICSLLLDSQLKDNNNSVFTINFLLLDRCDALCDFENWPQRVENILFVNYVHALNHLQ